MESEPLLWIFFIHRSNVCIFAAQGLGLEIHTYILISLLNKKKISWNQHILTENIWELFEKFRQIDGNYVKLAKDFVLGRKFHSQKSLRTKIRQVDEIFGRQRKFLSKILFSKLDGNDHFYFTFSWNLEHLWFLFSFTANFTKYPFKNSRMQDPRCKHEYLDRFPKPLRMMMMMKVTNI